MQLAAALDNIQLVQMFRHTDVKERLKPAAGSIPQRAGYVGFSVSRGSLEDNVLPIVNILAGREPKHLRFVQLPVLIIFNLLHSRRGCGELGVADKPVHPAGLAAVPLGSYQQAQAFRKAQVFVRRIGQLALKFSSHGA